MKRFYAPDHAAPSSCMRSCDYPLTCVPRRCATLGSRTFPTCFPSQNCISSAATPSASTASLRPRSIPLCSSSHPYSTSTLGTRSVTSGIHHPNLAENPLTPYRAYVRLHCNTQHTTCIIQARHCMLPCVHSNRRGLGGSTIYSSATSPAISSRRNGGPCISCGDCMSSTHTIHSWQRPRT